MSKAAINRTEPMQVRGIVERRLFDSARMEEVKRKLIENPNMSESLKKELFDWAAKPMFKWNFIGRFIAKKFGIDLQWHGLTGFWTKQAIAENLVTTRGKQVVAERIGGTGSQGAVTAIAIGIGTTAAAAGDTALQSESTTNGAARGAATVTNVTTTTTLDTEQWVKTFSFTGSFAITEEGLFDNNTSGGVMLARQVFSAVNVANGDSLQVTHKAQVS